MREYPEPEAEEVVENLRVFVEGDISDLVSEIRRVAWSRAQQSGASGDEEMMWYARSVAYAVAGAVLAAPSKVDGGVDLGFLISVIDSTEITEDPGVERN